MWIDLSTVKLELDLICEGYDVGFDFLVSTSGFEFKGRGRSRMDSVISFIMICRWKIGGGYTGICPERKDFPPNGHRCGQYLNSNGVEKGREPYQSKRDQ